LDLLLVSTVEQKYLNSKAAEPMDLKNFSTALKSPRNPPTVFDPTNLYRTVETSFSKNTENVSMEVGVCDQLNRVSY